MMDDYDEYKAVEREETAEEVMVWIMQRITLIAVYALLYGIILTACSQQVTHYEWDLVGNALPEHHMLG